MTICQKERDRAETVRLHSAPLVILRGDYSPPFIDSTISIPFSFLSMNRQTSAEKTRVIRAEIRKLDG